MNTTDSNTVGDSTRRTLTSAPLGDSEPRVQGSGPPIREVQNKECGESSRLRASKAAEFLGGSLFSVKGGDSPAVCDMHGERPLCVEEVLAVMSVCIAHLEVYPTNDHIRKERARIASEILTAREREREAHHRSYKDRIEKRRSGFVYLMRCNRNGLCKIGFSKRPEHRERTLQSEEPSIEMVGHWPGTMSDERELHDRFAGVRVRGEWFRLTADDVAHIKANMNTL